MYIKHSPRLADTLVPTRRGDYYDEMFPKAQGGRRWAEQSVLTSSSLQSLHRSLTLTLCHGPLARPSLRARSAEWGQNYIFPRTQVSKGRKEQGVSKEYRKLRLCFMPPAVQLGIPIMFNSHTEHWRPGACDCPDGRKKPV